MIINKVSSPNFEAAKFNRVKPKKVQRVISKIQVGKSLSESINSPLRREINLPQFDGEAYSRALGAGFFTGAGTFLFLESSFS